METLHAEQVWSRIEQMAEEQSGGVVATDGDGTLWSGDVGEDLFHAFLELGQVEEPALEAMRREALDHGLSDAGTGPDVARRIYSAYLDGRFPEERVCEVMTWCFGGWTRARMTAFARQVVQARNLPSRLNGEVLAVLDRARGAGVARVLVSASPYAVVLEAARHAGFDADGVVAACPQFEEEVMLARVERPIPYGPGKVQRLRERIGPRPPLYAAFGDNVFDIPLLSSARLGVAVQPKARLLERAHEVPAIVELASQPPSDAARVRKRP